MKRTALIAFLLSLLAVSFAPAIERPATEDEQRAWEAKYDKLNIRHSAKMRSDSSPDFLKTPENYADTLDFEIAATPPSIDFAIVTSLRPEYLPWGLARKTGGAWGGWGDVTLGPDRCFYFSLSNHLSYGASTYVLKYDPKTKKQSIVLDAGKVIGWKPDEFADGKIHGDIDFDSKGDTWMLTYFGPQPSREEWDRAYRGSWLLHFNAFTGKAENLGIPLEGASWPYFSYSGKQHLLFGVDNTGDNVIAYDTAAGKMAYGGAPPDNIRWYARCVMIDEADGCIYATDSRSKDRQFVRYSRRNNEFIRMKATVPVNPATGKRGDCRAHTESRDADGAFWCFDFYGSIFKFWPERDRTEFVCANWGKEGYYTANMARSPGGRYLYYIPGIGPQYGQGTPIVQYDTKRNKKKVLAFIYDYYMKKYGYGAVRPYGIEMDAKGESLFFYANGGFHTRENGAGWNEILMRRPAIFQVHIPASERME